jgi:proteasome lid subunit RPN8/RPN11
MTVIIPKKAYKTIVASSVRYANTRFPEDDWLEVYGIFTGKIEDDDVIISSAYPITHQEKKPEDIIDKVYWSTEDYESFSIIDDKAFSKGEFTVGWWHSHPGFKVMMSQLDVKTTLSYQQNNPKAISLVFNPSRLIRQVELPYRKGDPVKQLKTDPGFKIFRLDDINKGIEASYHEVMYKIQGYENMEKLVQQTQNFIVSVTNYFPRKNIFQRYEKIINKKVKELNSKLQGTESYLKTLVNKGEGHRTKEVLENQIKDIRKFVAQTYITIENIKEFTDYLEFKEKRRVVPKVQEILIKWDDAVSDLDKKFEEMEKKFT